MTNGLVSPSGPRGTLTGRQEGIPLLPIESDLGRLAFSFTELSRLI
jgi:hypothetical protein